MFWVVCCTDSSSSPPGSWPRLWILLLIVSVSWISFLIIGVLLAAYEVYLQRIKPAPPDEAPPASGPANQAGLPSSVGEA